MKSHAQQAADILTYISEPDSDMAVVVSLLKDMLKGFTREQAQAHRNVKPLAEYYVIQRLLTKARKLTGSKAELKETEPKRSHRYLQQFKDY